MELYSSSSITKKPSSGHDYEVFLSFRGPDTRAGFTDYLYHSLRDAGVHVFRDDEELRVGEEISTNLTHAINNSKISIPILSKGYASSKWCLKELLHIADTRKTGNQIVMPIFYNVSPFDVRNQLGSFEEDFQLHERRFGNEIVGKWKQTLKDIGSLKGWDLTSGRQHEGEVTKEVVNKVLRELKKSYMVETGFVIGVEDHVEKIKSIISDDSREVKFIGIHGTGGIGKTTLAKVIYNQLLNDHEGCSFLANVRDTSNHKDIGIMRLQNQLISDILKTGASAVNSVDEGIATIKERLSKKKVLICFDDVSKRNQLKPLVGDSSWFGPGSKIIITTRSKELLNEVEAYSSYEVTEMDLNRSLQLFSKHAFRRDIPPLDYMTYSEKAVKLTGGLPLALEVIGSLLHGKPIDSWGARLEKLENVPHEEVKENLMISYEELDDRQKQMFLDVACFFVGFDKTTVLYFWDSNLYPREGMEVLEDMSLLKIKEDNRIWMHDQLIDFGRSITYKNRNVKQENRSRLCVNDEALSILKKGQKEERIEAMIVKWEDIGEFGFRGKLFTSVPNLTFLQFSNYVPSSSFAHGLSTGWRKWTNPTILPQLRWLKLHYLNPHSLRIKLSACNLAILDLSNSDVTHKWDGWSQIKAATNLKVLNLSRCKKLKRTPDLSAHVKLERLTLHLCVELVQIHTSLCRLKRLVFLDLRDCYSLRELPEEVGQLESLMELDLTDSRVRVLPCSFGNTKSLKVLRLNRSGITELPASIGRAGNLEEICAKDCPHLKKIPSEIEMLSSLLDLKIFGSESKISQVPKLSESLIYLHLEFQRWELMNEVPDLSNLVNLRELDLKLYNHREEAPSDLLWWIGRLSKLETLKLTSYDIPRLCAEDDIIGSLSLLKSLHLVDCRKLQCLPRLPSSLVELHLLKCRSLKSICDISKLKKLSALSVSSCAVTEIRGLDYLENLQILSLNKLSVLKRFQEDLSRLSQLKQLTLRKLKKLQSLPRLPSSLLHISISYCNSLKGLIDVSNLNRLLKFIVFCSAIREICGLPSNLRSLDLSECEKLQSLPKLPSSLVHIRIYNCGQLLGLPRLPQNLVNLDIFGCRIKMLDVSNLTKLKKLSVTECPIEEIRGLHDLGKLSIFQLNEMHHSFQGPAHMQREITGAPFYSTVTD